MWRRALWGGSLLALVAGAFVLAGSDEVRALVTAGRYDEARRELGRDPGLQSSTDGHLLAARLAVDPPTGLALLGEVRGAGDAAAPTVLSAALDAAGIQLGAGEPAAALAVLEPLLATDRTNLPGQVLLLAGLAARGVGNAARASQLLAGVRPDDPAFAAARVVLGELSLEEAEPQRALRYLETAAAGPRAAAGLWQAQRLLGEDAAARGLLEDLQRDDPGGLSLLEIRRRLRLEADEATARSVANAATADTVVPTTAPDEPAGRYTLQLGAWSDRGRALGMLRRYGEQVPGLRIDTTRDERGQILYKVRVGAYANPARARIEADRLRDLLDLDVFVTDRGD